MGRDTETVSFCIEFLAVMPMLTHTLKPCTQDLVRWNTTAGKARGFRFHPSTLRLAVYIHGIAGTAAYNMLRNVIHLPSPERIKELRRNAAPPRVGVLVDNIQVLRRFDGVGNLVTPGVKVSGCGVVDCLYRTATGVFVEVVGGSQEPVSLTTKIGRPFHPLPLCPPCSIRRSTGNWPPCKTRTRLT